MKARLNVHLSLNDDLPLDLSIKLAHALSSGCRRLAEEDAFGSHGYPLPIYGIDHSTGRVCLNPTFRSEGGHILMSGEVTDVNLMPQSTISCCDLFLNNHILTTKEKKDLKSFSDLPWPTLTICSCVLIGSADRKFFHDLCDPERIRTISDDISCAQINSLIGTQVFRIIEESVWLVRYRNRQEAASC